MENIITARFSLQYAIGLPLPDLGRSSLDEWLYNGMPLSADHLPVFVGFSADGRGWELSYKAGHAFPWSLWPTQGPVAAAPPWLVYRGRLFSDGMPLALRHLSTSCWCSR